MTAPERPVYENFLVLKTAKGRLYVNPADVIMIETEDAEDKIVQRKPVLVLTVEKSAKKPTVYVSYLTNGLQRVQPSRSASSPACHGRSARIEAHTAERHAKEQDQTARSNPPA
jgi:hypothetical protein